jgi:hypothetical protein
MVGRIGALDLRECLLKPLLALFGMNQSLMGGTDGTRLSPRPPPAPTRYCGVYKDGAVCGAV